MRYLPILVVLFIYIAIEVEREHLQIDLIIRCSTLTRKKDNNVNAMQLVCFWKSIVDTIGKLKLMTEKMENLRMYVQKKHSGHNLSS
jgi:hypothetical protein